MLQRLLNFIFRPIAAPGIEALYRACIAQTRQPVFYADWQVPDTMDGRFDLLTLHVLLVIMRFEGKTEYTQPLFDLMFADMDKNLRQMGVSDMSIAKKMKPLLSAFYGRAQIYERALAVEDDTLSNALHRNLYGAAEVSDDNLRRITHYARHVRAELVNQPLDQLITGNIIFPQVTADV